MSNMPPKVLTTEEFNSLPLHERTIIRAENKLLKHFRGLESSSLLDETQTSEFIGYVKDLIRLARGGA